MSIPKTHESRSLCGSLSLRNSIGMQIGLVGWKLAIYNDNSYHISHLGKISLFALFRVKSLAQIKEIPNTNCFSQKDECWFQLCLCFCENEMFVRHT